MKKRFKVLVVTGLLFTGGTVGYASSSIFDNLDNIESNFSFILGVVKTKEQKVAELQEQLEGQTSGKSELEADIKRLESEIEEIKTNHASEITNKNSEISNKQKEIAQKQAEVDAKQSTINDLNKQLSSTQSQLSQAEARVQSLSKYTDSKVEEFK